MPNKNNGVLVVAAFHDYSVAGRAALAVVIPTLSALAVQVLAIPTALYSAHGMYARAFSKDLTDTIEPILQHLHQNSISANAIYSGFLLNYQQISLVENYATTQPDTFLLVDPVMGDAGKMYRFFDASIVRAYQKLVGKANVITPNYTEACLLANVPYTPKPDTVFLKMLVQKIEALGPQNIVITSVPHQKDEHFQPSLILLKLAFEGEIRQIETPYTPVHFPGTGDIFAATLLGIFLNTNSLAYAVQQSALFTSNLVLESSKHQYDYRQGVLLEPFLLQLLNFRNEKLFR